MLYGDGHLKPIVRNILISLLVISLIVIGFATVMLSNAPEKAPSLTIRELVDDYNMTTRMFKSYNVGDTISIHDVPLRFGGLVRVRDVYFESQPYIKFTFPVGFPGSEGEGMKLHATITMGSYVTYTLYYNETCFAPGAFI